MTDREETIVKQQDITTRKAIWADATVSTDDTVTFDSLSSITFSAVCARDDGTEMDHTVLNNVITITELAVANVEVEIFVNGLPAA